MFISVCKQNAVSSIHSRVRAAVRDTVTVIQAKYQICKFHSLYDEILQLCFS